MPLLDLIGKRVFRNARRGTAAVEFAVLAPLIVSLLLGMIEVTRAIQVKNYLTDTARSGCRKAIEPGCTNQQVIDNINAILTANGINSAYATITITVNGNSADVSTADKYDRIAVKIALPISQVNWVTPLFFSKLAVESETLVMMHQ